MNLIFHPIDPEFVASIRAGGADAYNRPAERTRSDGAGNPCRCCLKSVPKGAEMLVLAARPFESLNPYAETGPVFLCADACEPWSGDGVPPVLTLSPEYLIKGYDADERIVYGSGRVTPADEVVSHAAELLRDPAIFHVDVRSARNNCFLLRITEDQSATMA